MGGQAFADFTTREGRPVCVPRMSPELYKQVSEEYMRKLEALFEQVVVPRDAPAKKDHGDIDFLVQGISSHVLGNDIWAVIKHTIGAEFDSSRGGSHSFAVPHPTDAQAYVQVDVELSPGEGTAEAAELFAWTRFMKSDADLLQIIGVTHRPLGLTCNDQGLHIRVEQIEPYNKKMALLFLTRDPDAAMDFYGLNVAEYWAGFQTEDDMFDWACSGRFFSHQVFEGRVEKSNDRSRQAKRPMYRRFIEEYMPAHANKYADNTWTRPQVLEEALTYFNKQAEYDLMMEQHRLKEAEEELWNHIRTVLPAGGNSLGMALKSLKRWVAFENGQPHIANEPTLVDHPMWSLFVTEDNRPDVLDWVRHNWEQAKILEKNRANVAKEAAKSVC